MRSATVHSLPPELLRHVFESTLLRTRLIVELELSSHLKNVDNLLSFSLVHSTWTRLAQDVLSKHVWFGGRHGGLGKLLTDIETSVKALTVGGKGLFGTRMTVCKSPYIALWSQVVHLRLFDITNIDFSALALLPSLETILTERGNFLTPVRQSSAAVFPRLRQLTLCKTYLHGVEGTLDLFTTQSVPYLRHLSLCISLTRPSAAFETCFQDLFSCITSISLVCANAVPFDDDFRSIKDSLFRIVNLSHLSLRLPPRTALKFLLETPAVVELETLHFKIDIPEGDAIEYMEQAAMEAIAAVAGQDGDNQMIRAKKVYVYGYKQEIVRCSALTGMEELCWVKGEPPFRIFDGKLQEELQ